MAKSLKECQKALSGCSRRLAHSICNVPSFSGLVSMLSSNFSGGSSCMYFFVTFKVVFGELSEIRKPLREANKRTFTFERFF